MSRRAKTPRKAGPGLEGRVLERFGESARTSIEFARVSAGKVVEVALLIRERIHAGGKVLVFGNGGSAAEAQHFAAEFVNRFLTDRKGLAAIALTTDGGVLTSIGNDLGFDLLFARQVEALARPGDVAIALSTSGNSRNVLKAIEVCRKMGVATVGLGGGDGGKLAGRVDHYLGVGSTRSTPRIQESHLVLCHVLCELVEAPDLVENEG